MTNVPSYNIPTGLSRVTRNLPVHPPLTHLYGLKSSTSGLQGVIWKEVSEGSRAMSLMWVVSTVTPGCTANLAISISVLPEERRGLVIR